jgi:hypothetical protein
MVIRAASSGPQVRRAEHLAGHHRLGDQLMFGLAQQVHVVHAQHGDQSERQQKEGRVRTEQQRANARPRPHCSRNR